MAMHEEPRLAQLTREPVLEDIGRDSESVLVARAKADPRAFGELYRLHYRAVGACIYRRVGDVHTSEDLAAEVFIAAFRALRRFTPGPVPLRHWLLRIATNTVNRWSRRQRLAGWLPGTVREEPTRGVETEGSDRLKACLRRLPGAQQAVISLHYFEGLSVEEVGAAMGCSAGTVKSRLARARATLKELIGRGERP